MYYALLKKGIASCIIKAKLYFGKRDFKMKSIAENKKTARPIRVIQFGEGGFLRGFADWMLQKLNDKGLFFGGVAVVVSRSRVH